MRIKQTTLCGDGCDLCHRLGRLGYCAHPDADEERPIVGYEREAVVPSIDGRRVLPMAENAPVPDECPLRALPVLLRLADDDGAGGGPSAIERVVELVRHYRAKRTADSQDVAEGVLHAIESLLGAEGLL